MDMKTSFMRWTVLTILCLIAAPTQALTVEELLKLKEAGVSDETIQLFLRLEMERLRQQGSSTMGQRVVTGPDGKKRVITYFIEDPKQVSRERLMRDEEDRRSWEMLRQLLIDARRKEPAR
jgi:hypothetical protein